MTEAKKTATAAKTVKKAAPAKKTVAKKATVATTTVKLNGATYATGKRKDSVARVYLVPGKGEIFVNEIPADKYFRRPVLQMIIAQPFNVMVCLARRVPLNTVFPRPWKRLNQNCVQH